jgi:predicted RNase H-like HicB family nuclease
VDLTVVVHQEHPGYWSEVTELPGCFASGRTLEELREALQEAVEMCAPGGLMTLGDVVLRVGQQRVVAA